MNLAVETEQETDGRWLAEIAQIPGALAYGSTRQEAVSRAEALAFRVLTERQTGHLEVQTNCVFHVVFSLRAIDLLPAR